MRNYKTKLCLFTLHFSLFTILLVLLTSCESNLNPISPVPDAPVNVSINIMRDAPALDIPGNSYVITRPLLQNQYIGYSGIVIVHGLDGTFYAFDLCCPHEHSRDIRVGCSMILATCPSCGSTFDIGFGTAMPTTGPSQYPLRRYTVTQSGYNLHVTQ